MRGTRVRRRVAPLVVLSCALGLALPALASVRESSFVERAAAPFRATVSCYDRPDWATLVDSGYPDLKGREAEVYGLWRYEIRQVALPARGCRALEGWRHAAAARLSIWVFVLGHELTHAEQSDVYNAPWSRPFDEVEADCGGFAKFEQIRRALGIKRHLNPPPRGFARCPLKRSVGKR